MSVESGGSDVPPQHQPGLLGWLGFCDFAGHRPDRVRIGKSIAWRNAVLRREVTIATPLTIRAPFQRLREDPSVEHCGGGARRSRGTAEKVRANPSNNGPGKLLSLRFPVQNNHEAYNELAGPREVSVQLARS